MFSTLQDSWRIINDAEGKNDGLVPVTSQQFVAELVSDDGVTKRIPQKAFPVQADHLNEISWWDFEQLRNRSGSTLNIVQRILDYEATIKNVYVDIARSL